MQTKALSKLAMQGKSSIEGYNPDGTAVVDIPTTNPVSGNTGNGAPEYISLQTVAVPAPSGGQQALPRVPAEDVPQGTQLTFDPEIDRVVVIDFINAQGYMTYLVHKDFS